MSQFEEVNEAKRKKLRDLHAQAERCCQEDPVAFQKEPAAFLRNLLYELASELTWLEKQYDSIADANAQLEEQVAHYVNIFDLSPIGLIYLDLNLEHIILGANLFAAQMLGVSRSRLINIPFSNFVTPASLDILNVACGQLAWQGITQSLELEMKRENGELFWAGVEMNRIPRKAGGIYLIFALDITRRRMAEEILKESQERIMKVFHASPVALNLTSLPEGRYIDVNDTFLQLLEYTRYEVIGHTSAELNITDPEERARILRVIQEKGSNRNIEVTVKTKSGKILTVLSSSEKISFRGQELVISTIVDITELKQKQLEDISC